MEHDRNPQTYVDQSNFVAETAARSFKAADADGVFKPWWKGHLESSSEDVQLLRIGGFFEFQDNRQGHLRIEVYRVVAMAASPEGFISAVAYADPEPHHANTGERRPVIHSDMMLNRDMDEEMPEQEEEMPEHPQNETSAPQSPNAPSVRVRWNKPAPAQFRELLQAFLIDMEKAVLIFRERDPDDAKDDAFELRLFDRRKSDDDTSRDWHLEVEGALAKLFGENNNVAPHPDSANGVGARWDFIITREQYNLIG